MIATMLSVLSITKEKLFRKTINKLSEDENSFNEIRLNKTNKIETFIAHKLRLVVTVFLNSQNITL